MDEESRLRQYDFFPSLPELCEKPFSELKDQVGYAFTLYGMALGYHAGLHPAQAWLFLGKDLIAQLADVTKDDWEEIATSIADTLETRAHGKAD